jgi:hypothetical protein
MQRDFQAAAPNQQFAMDIRCFERACGGPGANLQAVWFRSSMLQLLAGPLHDGELADAVCEVARTLPMKRLSVGVVHKGPPFDLQEFSEQIEKKNNG